MAGSGARYFFLFLVGLVVGVVATVMGMRALDARRDPFPEALMHVQGYHFKQLRDDVAANRCNATDALPHLTALRTTASDLESAFPDLKDDKRFAQASSNFRATLDAARANPPLNCDGLRTVVKGIDDACKACHQDFRN